MISIVVSCRLYINKPIKSTFLSVMYGCIYGFIRVALNIVNPYLLYSLSVIDLMKSGLPQIRAIAA